MRTLSIAINDYHRGNGEFPNDLQALKQVGYIAGDLIDPYSPTGAPLGYKRVLAGSGEVYEMYTSRLSSAALICGWDEAEKEYWKHYTDAYERLRPALIAEGKNRALRPDPSVGDWLIFWSIRIRRFLLRD
jgi:hypothetical protein